MKNNNRCSVNDFIICMFFILYFLFYFFIFFYFFFLFIYLFYFLLIYLFIANIHILVTFNVVICTGYTLFANTVSPLYTDTRYNDKIPHKDNLNVTKSSLKKRLLMRNYAKTLHKIFKQHMFWIFKIQFYEEIKIKQNLFMHIILSIKYFYNNKFIIMATFFWKQTLSL